MLGRTKRWITARVGIRQTHPNRATLHKDMRRFSSIWFEGMKRVAILAVLAAAGKHSRFAAVLYFITLLWFIIPLGTWLEQYALDLKRLPPIDVHREDGPKWKYSFQLELLSNVLIAWMVNFGVQEFVEQATVVFAKP